MRRTDGPHARTVSSVLSEDGVAHMMTNQTVPRNRQTLLARRRRTQLGLHVIILLVLLLSVAPVYILVNISLKNPLQYEYDRWAISFPLRFSNYSNELTTVG